MDGIIIILGSTNNEYGHISDIGIQRLEKGMEVYQRHKNYRILLTGGYGSNFNTTSTPYAEYAKRFLISNSIPEDVILDLILSSDTVQDATMSYKMIRQYSPQTIIVVTSDFHLERVQFIFSAVFNSERLCFEGVHYSTSKEKMDRLYFVENREMKLLKETGKSSFGHSIYEYDI